MPIATQIFQPYKARVFDMVAGVLTDTGTVLPCDIVISTTSAIVETGLIIPDQLGKVIFPTSYRTTVSMGQYLLVNGSQYKIVGPIELQNAIQSLQVCEAAIQRVDNS